MGIYDDLRDYEESQQEERVDSVLDHCEYQCRIEEDEDEAKCHCHGRGWHLTDLDTWVECRTHPGRQHPESRGDEEPSPAPQQPEGSCYEEVETRGDGRIECGIFSDNADDCFF